jgi:methionyl-tRNA formyltransferase
MNDLRIIFMGTPEFAVPGLQTLLNEGKNVVAVITAPDKPAGRGLLFQMSPVKELAFKNNIPVLQPVNLKATDFIEELKGYHADLQIVIAFRMLPEQVWSLPRYGTFNLHASLLPQYRGAAPINWAIINGEKETGVTTFFLRQEIDTGNIIYQEREPILPEDDFESLYQRLMHKGASLVLKTVQSIENNVCPSIPQENTEMLPVKMAPKIHKETCFIVWGKKSHEVVNFIRGLSPYPAAWTKINGKTFKIYKGRCVDGVNGTPGEFITDGKSYLYFYTADGAVSVEELQMEGKKRMDIQGFLRGNKF